MRKQTHFKKVVSFALAAAMAVSVCTAALADDATNEATEETAVSEQTETESADETDNGIAVLTAAESGQPVVFANEGEGEAATQDEKVMAKIGDVGYSSLKEAAEAVPTDNTPTTIVLQDDEVGGGIQIQANKNVVFDLNGHTYTVSKPTVGSSGTETNGFQLLKGSTVTFKNGAIKSTTDKNLIPNGGMLIQNYCDLTLDNVTLDTTDTSLIYYVVSNNCGKTVIKNNTSILAATGRVAFDLWYGNHPSYYEGLSVTFDESFTGTVKGKIEYGAHSTAASQNADWTDKTKLAIAGGQFDVELVDSNPNDNVTADGFNITIAGGKFKNELNKNYIADGKVCKTEDGAEYPYVVGEKTVTPKPAEPETTVKGDVEDIKSEDVDKNEVANAAASTTITDSEDVSASDVSDAVKNAATVKIGEEEVKLNDDKVVSAAKDAIAEAVKKAAEEKPDAPEKVFDQDANVKDISIIAVPKLVVEPKAAANNDTDVSMTFDIKMLYDVKATVAAEGEKVTEWNSVTLEKDKDMPAEQVPTVAISLDVSALKIPAGKSIFVRHVKENGEVYYYDAVYDKGKDVVNGIVKTVTFVNPDGFSEFTVMANKDVTVTIDGKEYTFSAADIGKGFEIAKKDYCDWKGASFKGIEGVYTTLTKELYDKAANGQKLEGTNVFEQVWFPPEEPSPAPTEAPTPAPTATPAPVEEAAPVATAAPTATPDDSQYYTCVACGHHNWTATADGYKCDTCGHLETKQISGYKNVKGVYTPTASSAKSTAAKAATIPQTSDEMPIVPIAIVAIAALLGLGVTLYMKKKQN